MLYTVIVRKKINEKSETKPSSFHGFMHLIRENMLNELDCLKSFIRPTLVYGKNDPHNGYGPNKFIRCAQKNEKIIMFGKGEERRDHIHVDNVADIVFHTTINQIGGIINAVSGNVISFYDIIKNLKKDLSKPNDREFKKEKDLCHTMVIVHLIYHY